MAEVTRTALCSKPGCWVRSVEAPGGVPLCAPHLRGLREALGLAPVAASQVEGAPLVTCSAIVYFVTLDGGQTVKIGTTSNPRQRFAALEKRAGSIDLLVAHPGSYREERAAHRRFRHLSAGRKEYFRLDEELLAAVSDLQAEWPNWRLIVRDVEANA